MEPAELIRRLERCRSRGEVKALGQEADRDPDLRAALLALQPDAGAEVGVLSELSGKALVRRLLAREEEARLRRNPIHRDEAFTCAWCGAAVARGGAMVRDHCPRCLRSRHVDQVPGDRAADCGGLLEPVQIERQGENTVLHYRCARCGHLHRVRAHPDDEIPLDLRVEGLPGAGALRDQGRARTLPLRVLEAIRRHGLWQPGERVLVAVSGGLDSTVLLELLVRLAPAHGGRLEVMSLDHGLRSEASQEVATVAEHARRLAVPFHTADLGLVRGPALQARARAARRAALLALGADRIATAHHQDDQAETVLQHLVAGSGAAGLSGMAALDPPWCRPLLAEPRAVLRAWAEGEGLRWVEDPSNADSERGRLRSLLEGLGELREGASKGLARSARLLARDDAFLEGEVDALWPELSRAGGLDFAAWSALPPALALRCLRRLLGPGTRADTLERALEGLAEGGSLDLEGGARLRCEGGLLRRVEQR